MLRVYLAQKYFSSPEVCFTKADEELTSIRAPISNSLYSQIIQRKITPLACNNVLTGLYNNHIEESTATGPDIVDSILPEDKVAPVMVLDGMDDGINDKNDSQIVEEIADIKDSILVNSRRVKTGERRCN